MRYPMHGSADHPLGANPRLSAALQQALIDASWRYRATHDALRDAVCAYVENLRRDGVPLSEIVSSVRSSVADLRAAGEVAPAPVQTRDALLEQLVAWCGEFGIRPG